MISLEEYKKRIKIANVALTAGGIFFILFGLYMVATVFFYPTFIVYFGIVFIVIGIGFLIFRPLYVKRIRRNIEKDEAELRSVRSQ